MPTLVSVRGPHARNNLNNRIRVQWNMGNSCNYSCVYCPEILHNASKPWLKTEVYLDTIDKLTVHYNALHKVLDYELIGGEVTVIPGFEDIVKRIHESGSTSVVYTNASRTINWWSKAKHYMDGVVLTFHPLTQDKEHFINVVNEIKEHVTIDINIAGIGGRVEELGEFVEELRTLFVNCQRNNYYNVSICVKTMYQKLLGKSSKQQTFYNYTDKELEVLQRPGVTPMPVLVETNDSTESVEPDPTAWMTEFMFDDGSTKYVQSHQIINEGLNTFKGMKCHLGFESINIDASGDIYSSWCGAVNFGNISDSKWKLLETKPICPFDYCNNISDISITKTR